MIQFKEISPVEESLVSKEANDLIDALELKMSDFKPVSCPLVHRFTPGMYSRQIFMKKGLLLTSKIHKTIHQYIVSQGRVSVWTEGEGWVEIEAPYTGITIPGARRVLFTHEETIWTTFHPTRIHPKNNSYEEVQKAVDRIERVIIEKHDNQLLTEEQKRDMLYWANGRIGEPKKLN